MRLAVAAGTTVVLALVAPAARADIFAVADARGPVFDSDVALVDASTGARVPLPASINTNGVEAHPSISADGTKLVFTRVEGPGDRILLASLPSGTLTDLFNGFEQAANLQRDPAISPDGKTVATGEPFQSTPDGQQFATLTLTDVSQAPFTRSRYMPHYSLTPGGGSTGDPAFGGSDLAYTESRPGTHGELILGHRAFAELPLTKPAIHFAHPAFGDGIVAFEERAVKPDGTLGLGDIYFAPTGGIPGAPPVKLPISTVDDENRPAFTSDGRYVGFVRHTSDGHDRVFVWDSQTQTLINDTGADLGVTDLHDSGNVSLYVKSVILSSSVTSVGLVTVQTVKPSRIGILVQRVIGHQKLLGRTAPKLQMVGRVPLGNFKKGRGHVRWDGRVNGRKLKPGTYQVTPRAVSPKGAILDFGTPRTFRVK